MDQIVGILYQKDFYNTVYHTKKEIKDVMRPVHFTTKNKKIDTLLKELQQKKMHIAVVVDEFGGTMGIVTLEDIVEEIVGEIWDEHDTVVQEIEKIADHEYMLSGKANIEKVFEILGIDKEHDVMTVSGWVMEELGRIPVEGDEFEEDHLKVRVVKMSEKRIEKVWLKELEKEEEKDEDKK